MYLLSDRLYYFKHEKDHIEFVTGKKQIVFTQLDNKSVMNWLEEQNFPETFIEDIHNNDQSITYEQNKVFKLIILKYFREDKEEENIAIIITKDKFVFLSRDDSIVKNVVSRLYKRYDEEDSLEYITYTVIDIIVDHTMRVVDRLEDKLEMIEDQIFDDDVNEKEIQTQLYFSRRTLNRIAKLSVQTNDAVNKTYNNFSLSVRKNLEYEFIDLKEHLSYLIHESKSYLDRTGYLQNLLMGFLSNRMNQAMQRLAAISLIFLPLTFIVGNYGMNFKNMPELDWKYGYFIIWGVNIAIAWLIFRWLKKQKWI